MEFESLFSSTRWDILKALSKESLSPLEIADRMKTTSANVSQQLRLLELAGLVRSVRTSNADKGKPRVVYSLSGDVSFIILAEQGLAEKKMLQNTDYSRYMIKSLFFEIGEHQSMLGSIYFSVKDHLDTISAIAASSTGGDLSVFFASGSEKTVEFLKKITEGYKKVRFAIVSPADFKKKASGAIMLYDSNKKGGE